jgi:ankyrin repeat protein
MTSAQLPAVDFGDQRFCGILRLKRLGSLRLSTWGNVMRNILYWIVVAVVFAASAHAGPVGDAAKKGDTAEIERLMASGADANEEDAMASPLHWAAMNGHDDAMKLLVEQGADLEA